MSAGDVTSQYSKFHEMVEDLDKAIDDAADSSLAKTLRLSDGIRAAGATAMIGARILDEDFREFAELGNIAKTLRDRANSWQTLVVERADALAGELSFQVAGSGLHGTDHWGGAAKTRYMQMISDNQKPCVEKLSTQAGVIEGTLGAVADGTDTALATILVTIYAAEAQIAVALLALAAVVTAEASLAFLATTFQTAIAGFAAVALELYILSITQKTQAGNAKNAVTALGEWKPPDTTQFGPESPKWNWIAQERPR